jgi:Phosphotransferase enzyme family
MMQEQVRNELLRRIDGRFLLDDPQPATTLCLAEELAQPLSLVSRVARAFSPEEQRTGVDLAVASDPTPKTLSLAWNALRPRGSLYTEWRSTPLRSWEEIASDLRRAGFDDVACYWPRPDPSLTPAFVWFPLEAKQPLEFYRTRRTATRNPVRVAGRAVRRVQWMVRARRPVCAVARKPAGSGPTVGVGDGDSMIETIRKSWSGWRLGPAPRQIFRLLQAAPGRSSGKVLAFLFAEGDEVPRAVIKMARTADATAGLQREAEILRLLEARPGGLPGIPRILLSRPQGIVETVLPGLPLYAYLGRRSYSALTAKAASWLAELAGPDDGTRRDSTGLVDQILAEFVSRFESVLDPGFLRELQNSLAELPPLRPVCEQRDFSPWNVLLTRDGSLSVLDWESSAVSGLPGLDLVYFHAYLALYFDRALHNGRHRESFRRSLDPTSLTGSASEASLAWYAQRLSIPKDAIRPLRLLAWVLHSRSEYRHLAEDSGGSPERQRLRQSFFLDLLEEEMR